MHTAARRTQPFLPWPYGVNKLSNSRLIKQERIILSLNFTRLAFRNGIFGRDYTRAFCRHFRNALIRPSNNQTVCHTRRGPFDTVKIDHRLVVFIIIIYMLFIFQTNTYDGYNMCLSERQSGTVRCLPITLFNKCFVYLDQTDGTRIALKP